MPWAKRKKVQSPLNQPVNPKNSQPKPPKPVQKPVQVSEEKVESSIQPVSSLSQIQKSVPLSSTSSSTPSTPRKAAVVLGRRPDYKHSLVGLSIGDEIVFHKNPHIKAKIEDTDWKVSIDGVDYEGIIAAAEEAYKVSGLTPPKRVTGLSEWRDPSGVRLRVLYEKLPPLTSLPQPTTTQESTV
jgi:hypothetical protein